MTPKCAGQRGSRAGWYRDVCTERSVSPCCVSLVARPLGKTLPTPWCYVPHHCQSSINVCTTYALCVLVSYVYLKLLTAVNFKNERKKKKKYALNIRGIVWSWKKIKSGVLKHDILREFEISKSTYYRFIVREHLLLLKNLPKLKFLLIIFYVLTVFILFWLKTN